MKKTTVRLDDQIHTLLVRLAEKRSVSLNHLINYALVRFISFEEAFEMLEDRARRA
jgi:predicted HicB family RNase H-like nuclease